MKAADEPFYPGLLDDDRLVFRGRNHPRTDAVLASVEPGGAIVPSLWPLEVANALVMCERRKRVSAARVAEFANFVSGGRLRLTSRRRGRLWGIL